MEKRETYKIHIRAKGVIYSHSITDDLDLEVLKILFAKLEREALKVVELNQDLFVEEKIN